MNLFKRKPKEQNESAPKGMMGFAYKMALRNAESSLKKAFKEGRIIFKDNGIVDYTFSNGEHYVEPISQIAERVYESISNHLVNQTGDNRASLEAIGVVPKDIENIIEKLK